jgi:hypothetical protein
MTKVITRYFESADRASSVLKAFQSERFPPSIMRLYDEAEGLADALKAARVDAATAEAYQQRVVNGGAVVLVNAGHTPLNVARTARDVMARMGAADMGDLTEEVVVPDKSVESTTILKGHPLLLTRKKDPEKTNFYMADWPIPLISRRKPYTETVVPRHGRMADWPLPLISRIKPRDEFAFPRHARMANLLLPLTIRRKPSDNFLFPRHARMANLILPLISRRKPYTGSLIERHARFANWPFPLLINGKAGTNSLIPGAPHMADSPVPLLSDRKPADKFAFPRHARMANLILPLLSRREPFTGSIFPRHARMANFILPLVSKRSEKPGQRDRIAFSFSRLLGIPTLIRR